MRVPRPAPAQLGTGALVIAALALGQLLDDALPETAQGSRPFLVEVTPGPVVDLRAGSIQVTRVQGARSVVDVGTVTSSPGLVLVVSFEYTARREPSTIQYAELHDAAGRVTTFSPLGGRSIVSCPAAPVGLASSCVAVVEADPRTLPGARLRLGPNATDERWDAMADVDLQVEAEDVAAWMADEGPLELPYRGPEGLS